MHLNNLSVVILVYALLVREESIQVIGLLSGNKLSLPEDQSEMETKVYTMSCLYDDSNWKAAAGINGSEQDFLKSLAGTIDYKVLNEKPEQ